MKYVEQPRYKCPRCRCDAMAGIGITGMQDICRCPVCGKLEFFRRQERRGRVTTAKDNYTYEVTMCSGEIEAKPEEHYCLTCGVPIHGSMYNVCGACIDY